MQRLLKRSMILFIMLSICLTLSSSSFADQGVSKEDLERCLDQLFTCAEGCHDTDKACIEKCWEELDRCIEDIGK